MISTQGSYISNISQLHYGRRMPYSETRSAQRDIQANSESLSEPWLGRVPKLSPTALLWEG